MLSYIVIVEQRLQKDIYNCKTFQTGKTTTRTLCLRSKIKIWYRRDEKLSYFLPDRRNKQRLGASSNGLVTFIKKKEWTNYYFISSCFLSHRVVQKHERSSCFLWGLQREPLLLLCLVKVVTRAKKAFLFLLLHFPTNFRSSGLNKLRRRKSLERLFK